MPEITFNQCNLENSLHTFPFPPHTRTLTSQHMYRHIDGYGAGGGAAVVPRVSRCGVLAGEREAGHGERTVVFGEVIVVGLWRGHRLAASDPGEEGRGWAPLHLAHHLQTAAALHEHLPSRQYAGNGLCYNESDAVSRWLFARSCSSWFTATRAHAMHLSNTESRPLGAH